MIDNNFLKYSERLYQNFLEDKDYAFYITINF